VPFPDRFMTVYLASSQIDFWQCTVYTASRLCTDRFLKVFLASPRQISDSYPALPIVQYILSSQMDFWQCSLPFARQKIMTTLLASSQTDFWQCILLLRRKISDRVSCLIPSIFLRVFTVYSLPHALHLPRVPKQ
jgi:hypothetical protein